MECGKIDGDVGFEGGGEAWVKILDNFPRDHRVHGFFIMSIMVLDSMRIA